MAKKILCAMALCSFFALAACGSAPDNMALPGGIATGPVPPAAAAVNNQ